MHKQVFCSFCGRILAEFDITVSDDAHVNKLPLGVVCDLPCARGTQNDFGPHDFIQEKKNQDLKCVNCGGSITMGSCSACTAMAQMYPSFTTNTDHNLSRLTYTDSNTELD